MRKKNQKLKEQTGKAPIMKKIISDLIFYGILISMVVATLAVSGKNGGPRMFGPFSAFTVLSGSMEEVIPKGSLVVTRRVNPSELKVGDDITYMVNESTTVTHRIIEIQEDYLSTGQRAFRTQGVMNEQPDTNPVMAVNVVGKVIYHNKMLGTAVKYGQDNWPLVIFFIAIFLFFVKTVEYILRKDNVEKDKQISEHLEENSDTVTTIVDEDGFVLEIIELYKQNT